MLAARHKASLKSIFAQTYPLTQYSHNVLPRLGHQLMNHSALRYRHSDDLITRWPCQAISPIPLFPSQNRPIQTKYRPSPCLPPISSHHNSPLEKLSHTLSAHEISRVRTSLEHAFRISGREGSPSSSWESERAWEGERVCYNWQTVEGNAVSQRRSPTGVYAVKCWRADIAHESSSPPKSGVVGALFFGGWLGGVVRRYGVEDFLRYFYCFLVKIVKSVRFWVKNWRKSQDYKTVKDDWSCGKADFLRTLEKWAGKFAGKCVSEWVCVSVKTNFLERARTVRMCECEDFSLLADCYIKFRGNSAWKLRAVASLDDVQGLFTGQSVPTWFLSTFSLGCWLRKCEHSLTKEEKTEGLKISRVR